MPSKNTTFVIVMFALVLCVAAVAVMFTVAPDTLQSLAEGGATIAGKCVGSGAGSCDLG